MMPVKAMARPVLATQLKNVAVSEAPMLDHVQRVMESAAQVSVHILISKLVKGFSRLRI